jgi:hypothetical protein
MDLTQTISDIDPKWLEAKWVRRLNRYCKKERLEAESTAGYVARYRRIEQKLKRALGEAEDARRELMSLIHEGARIELAIRKSGRK